MFKYIDVRNKVKNHYDWSDVELNEKVKLAQLWHNPLNFDDGNEFKVKYNWDILFSEALKKEGLGNRFYFKFHDYDMTDVDVVLNAFINSSNWKKYVKVWKKYAPETLNNESVFALAVTEMSVRGFKLEEHLTKKFIDEGKKVVKSSFIDDIKHGIDLWVDGEPVQVKSPGTIHMMNIKGVKL